MTDPTAAVLEAMSDWRWCTQKTLVLETELNQRRVVSVLRALEGGTALDLVDLNQARLVVAPTVDVREAIAEYFERCERAVRGRGTNQ